MRAAALHARGPEFFEAPAVAAAEAEQFLGTKDRTQLSRRGLSGAGSPAAKRRGDPTGPKRSEARTPRGKPRRAGTRIGSPRPAASARRPPAAFPRQPRDSSLPGRVRAVPGLASAGRGGDRARAEKRRRESNWPEEKRRRRSWRMEDEVPGGEKPGTESARAEDSAVRPGPSEGLPRPSPSLGPNGGAVGT